AVPADRPVEAAVLELPDGGLPLRAGLPEERLRARGGDLDPDAGDGRGAERRLRAEDGADGGRAVRRQSRRSRVAWNAVGLVVLVVMVFPVFWMVSTAFKADDEINRQTPALLPLHATFSHFREAVAGVDHPY